MSSIDSSSRKAQQTSLSDLQSEHNRKRKEVVSKNEQELSSLKDYYNQKKESLVHEGEAAINHIRSRQQKQIEEATAERERLSQNYSQRSASLANSYNERLQSTKQKNEHDLAATQTYGQQRVKKAQDDSNFRLEQVSTKSETEIAAAKQNNSAQLRSLVETNEKRLQNLKEQNALATKTEIERSRLAQAKLKGNIENEFSATVIRGDEKIEQAELTHTHRLERLNSEQEKTFRQTQDSWASKENSLNQQYSQRLLHQKSANEKEIKNLNERFQNTYQKNELAQQEALNIQKQHFNRALAETKKDFARSAEKYANRKEDPFYKVEDRGSELRENPDSYFLRAYIPEHEKDNVRVAVRENKVVVSGQRSFNDKVEDGSKKISTSNYQSFREEFSFDVPVNTKGMKREREGDWVTFTIPKGYASRLNTKA